VTTPERSEARGLFVYAVTWADSDLPDTVTGIDQSPLAVVPHGRLAAVVSLVEVPRGAGRKAELVAYSAVMEALLALGAVVPVSFGTIVPDEQTVVDEVLAPREPALAELLERLDGRVQYNVRASYVEDAVLAEIVGEHPEIQRLRERTRDLPDDARIGDRIKLGELVSHAWTALARADADRLLSQLGPFVSAHALRREPGPQTALDAALLVDRSRSDELEDHLEALAEQSDGRLRLSLLGPVAPYDFVGGV
jgi:hypothetical protein